MMFTQTFRASQASFKSILSKAKKRFTSSNSHLSGMLEKMSKDMKVNGLQEDLIILDRLNRTSYSTTFRAFDKTTRSFVAHRTVFLTSTMAWNQMEMIMKQHKNANQSSHFSDVISIHYDKPANEVTILTKLDKTVLGDVASYLMSYPEKYAFLKEFATQLTELSNEAKSLDYTFEGLDLENLFIDLQENRVKVHDLANFEPRTINNKVLSSDEAISDALVKMAGAPKDMEFLKRINLATTTSEAQNHLISIIDDDYNKFMTEKLLKILEDKGSIRFTENATLLKEALNESNPDQNFGHIQALKQQKEILMSQAKYYKTLDQFEKASKCYSEAFIATQKIERLEKYQAKLKPGFEREEQAYKSPLVAYLDSLPRPLTQVVFPSLVIFLIIYLCGCSLERNKDAWETPMPKRPSEAEIATKKLEEEKSKEKRQRLIQTLKFGLSVALLSLGLVL